MRRTLLGFALLLALALISCDRAPSVLDGERVAPTAEGFVVTFPAGLASVAIAADGSRLALAHNVPARPVGRTRLLLFDAATGTPRWSDAYPNRVCCAPPLVRITPDGAYILGVGDRIQVYERQGRPLFTTALPGDKELVNSAALSDDGKWVAVSSYQRRAYLYAVATRQLAWSDAFAGPVSIALSGDGRWLLVVEPGGARLYMLSEVRLVARWPLALHPTFTQAGLSRDAGLAVAAGYDPQGNVLVDLYDRRLDRHRAVNLGRLLLWELQVAPDGAWVQFAARFKGGAAIVTRAGQVLARVPPSEQLNGPTLARDDGQQAQTVGQTIRLGERVFQLDGIPQAVWLTGERLAALGAPTQDTPLADRLWVWSIAAP